MVAAVESGRIPPERIQAAVARIQAAKARLQPLALQLDYFQTTPAVEVATTIAQDSLERAGQALQPVPLGVNCLIVDDTLHASFLNRTCPALTLPPLGALTNGW